MVVLWTLVFLCDSTKTEATIRNSFEAREYANVVAQFEACDPNLSVELLSFVAKSYFYIGKNSESALTYIKCLALPIKTDSLSFRIFTEFALVLIESNNCRKAQDLLDAAKMLVGEDLKRKARWLNTQGVLYHRESKFDEALMVLGEAQTICEKNSYAYLLSLVLSNVGIIHRQVGNLFAAKRIYETILRSDEEINDLDAIAVDYSNLANVYYDLNDLSGARKAYENAIKFYRAAKDSAGIALVYGNLSYLYTEEEEYLKAKEAVGIALDYSAQNHDLVGMGNWLLSKAEINKVEGKYDQSQSALDSALVIFERINRKTDVINTLIALGDLSLKANRIEVARDYFDRACAFSRMFPSLQWIVLGRLALSFEGADWRMADSLYGVAINQMAFVNDSEAQDNEDFYFFEEKCNELYRNYVRVLIEKEDIHRAIEVYEKSKSQKLEAKLGHTPYDEDLQIAEYFLSTPDSYVFYRIGDKWSLNKLPSRTFIASNASALMALLASKSNDSLAIRTLSSVLFTCLLPNFDKFDTKKALVIVPDGILSLLPFEVLGQNEFLIEKLDVVYAPSLRLYKMIAPPHKSISSITIYANEKYRDFSPLSGVLKEAAAISSHFKKKSTYLLANKSKNQLLTKNESSIYHFAMHGIVDLEKPEASALVFGEDSLDQLVTAKEIERMNFKNATVVLSACQTGRGRIFKSEGVIGLTRSFLIAGASNVVSSLWKIEDHTTASFMDEFYSHLTGEYPDVSRSLRKAKLNWIMSRRPIHEWAGFVIWGRS